MSLLTEILNINSVDPDDINGLVNSVSTRIDKGEIDPLRTFIQFKATANAIAEVLKEIQPEAIKESMKYAKDGSHMLGFKFSIRSGYAQYSFDHDPEYKKLSEAIEARKKIMKAAAKIKKAVADEESGELIQPAKIKGYTADSLTIRFE